MVKSASRWVLSGGIGSGKSEVRRLLEECGVRTIDADSVGHEVLAGPARDQVIARWPDVAVNGDVDRAALGRIVFADREALAELEGITHPHIIGMIKVRLEGFDGPAVVEMPLLATIDDWPRIVVDADDQLRMDRAVARGMDETEVRARMELQPSRGEWMASADVVIPNYGDFQELEKAVGALVPLLG